MIPFFHAVAKTYAYTVVGKLVPLRKKGVKYGAEVQLGSLQNSKCLAFPPLVLRVYTRWHARKAEHIQKLDSVDTEFFGRSP